MKKTEKITGLFSSSDEDDETQGGYSQLAQRRGFQNNTTHEKERGPVYIDIYICIQTTNPKLSEIVLILTMMHTGIFFLI